MFQAWSIFPPQKMKQNVCYFLIPVNLRCFSRSASITALSLAGNLLKYFFHVYVSFTEQVPLCICAVKKNTLDSLLMRVNKNRTHDPALKIVAQYFISHHTGGVRHM